MELVEIVLLIAGLLVFILSFVIPANMEVDMSDTKELAKEEIKDMVSAEMLQIKNQVNDVVEEAVTYAVENDRLLFFQCAKGLFSGFKEAQLCNAIYQKKDGTLLMNNAKEGFTDDLTHFMPFHPEDFTQKGEYIGALNVVKIQKWLEAHPETKLEGALAPLAGLAEDANPVVVIVEP